MAIEFKLPDLGEGIESADISRVLVKEGDQIEADQPVAELETEKAVMELPCPHKGRVAKVHIKEGTSIAVGAPVLTIEEAAPKEAPAKPAASAPPAATAPKKEPAKPAPAPATPPAAKPAPKPTAPAAPTRSTAPAMAPVLPRRPPSGDGDLPPAPAGPATRRLARELGVDLYQIAGTGSGGRITADDVQAYVRTIMTETQTGGLPAGQGPLAAPPLPDFSQFGPVERRPLNKIAKTAATNLSIAWQTIPHVTQHELADITDLEAARKRYLKAHGERAPKLTMTVLALKAVVAALKAFPNVNASFDAATGEVVLKQYFHLGVAVDTEHGLVVPVLRDVDQKNIVTLAQELTDIAQRARDRKLDRADFKGGCFTISNLGGIGGTFFTPIINPPEVAILGLSRARTEPVYREGAFEPRLMLPLSLSYDHRVINGADGARFIGKVAAFLSDPIELLVEI